MKLNAQELRDIDENEAKSRLKALKRRPIYLILEDVLDTYNIGGLFRLADALTLGKIYLCGGTETPPNSRIKKASVGTYKVVPWKYKKTAVAAIAELKKKHPKIQIIAVEQDKKAVPYQKISYRLPLALVVGNETTGISKKTLQKADFVAEIPMWGINKSLNVIVSAAIV
ncbi:hypothetical protein A3E69_04555, partial [Candidatus Roizmanbacteria bacterium RIFCSPHIGHO2_12_FULL_40_130]